MDGFSHFTNCLVTCQHQIKSLNQRILGPLHTRAKTRDHETLRAQKKVCRGRPNTPPQSCSVVTDPQVYCEAICDRALNQMLCQ